jgi:hypothetical protein
MADQQATPGPKDRAAAASYIAALTADLGQIARRHKLDLLGYLLEMAHMEAQNQTRDGSK